MATLCEERSTSSGRVSINAVLFDLDNTIIETRRADNLTCEKLSEELTENYGIPREESVKITTTYLKLFRQYKDNGANALDIWRMRIWRKVLENKYSHLASAIYERWVYLRYHHLAPAEDTITMLRQMRKKYQLALITNGSSNVQWEKIEKLSLQQYFDIILVSGDLPWEKPDAKIFFRACSFINVRPQNCIMVGDKLETDILGAINAGLYSSVWKPISDKPQLTEGDPKPDFTIRRITELIPLLDVIPTLPELEDCSSNGSDGL